MLTESPKNTIYEYLLWCAENKPNQLLLADETEAHNYEEVLQAVNDTACGLNKIGIRVGSRVVLRVERRTRSVVMLLALMAIGAVTHLVDEKTTVIDFFNEERFSQNRYYISNENNTVWVSVSLTEEDCDIVPMKGEFEVNHDATLPVITFDELMTADELKQWTEREILEKLTGCTGLPASENGDKTLCITPMSKLTGFFEVMGSMVLNYSVVFPKLFSSRHVLHCVDTYHISAINAIWQDYLDVLEYIQEYDLSSLRLGIIGVDSIDVGEAEMLHNKLGIKIALVSADGGGEPYIVEG